MSASLISTDGVSSVSWTVAGTDETRTTSSYTLTPSGSVGQSVSFTAGAAGTAVILKATINGGVNPRTGNVDATMSATGKAFVPTATGVEVIAAGENFESSSTHGWAAAMNPALRLAGSGTAGVSAVAGSGRITSTGGANPTVSSAALETLGDNALTSAVDLSDATGSITVAAGKRRSVPAISAERVYTLSTSGAAAGDTISVHRPASRRFPVTFVNGGAGGDRWGAKTAGLYAFRFDGTNWAQISAPASNGAVHLNVRDFGALGDGTTNDTAAIQACLAAVPDGGGEVFFPPGQYLVTDNLLIERSHTKVYGAGSRLSQLYGPTTWTPSDPTRTPANAFLLYIDATNTGPDAIQMYDIEIAHLSFYGDSNGATAQKAIYGGYLTGLLVHDCHFEHFGRETITNGTGCSRHVIRDNTFKDCGHNGAGVLGVPSTINLGVDDSIVSGNHSDNCYGSIGVAHCARVTVVNNVIKNPLIYGITIGDGVATTDITISGNSITALVPNIPTRVVGVVEPLGAIGIAVQNNLCKNITISGNAIGITLQDGCANNAAGIKISGGLGVMISGNSIAIDFAGADDVPNSIVAFPAHGILVEPNSDSDVSIIGNHVRTIGQVADPGLSWHGIAAASHGYALKSNVVGNRVLGVSSSLSGFSYALTEQGGGTHSIQSSCNSHDSTGYLALVGVASMVGLTDHAIAHSNICHTTFGARSRYPSIQQAITAAGNSITVTYAELVRIANGTGGSITLTSTPTIANGYNGQTITIINFGTQNVVLQDQGTLASSNLRLTATTITLGPRHSVELTYFADYADWFQTGPVVAVI